MGDVIPLRRITERVMLPLPFHLLDQKLAAISEKVSKLNAAKAAEAAGDTERANLLYLQCRALGRLIHEIERQRKYA
jgi:hypothetical protein